MSSVINKLLIANRAEIAQRIMRTARSMGIATVAVYADADAAAPYVRCADQKIALRGQSAAETYLHVDKLLAAAHSSGADAVHPGYGFLAENAGFAQAVIDAGLNWVGPSPSAIAAMGDKLAAKQLMTEAGVPQLPSVELPVDGGLAAAAEQVGFPLLVKAAAGGGGKGMRVVETADELDAAVEAAKREAGTAFGDETVFLERWLQQVSHVEVQVLGDTHGNLVHCFERECSIQRRHQKIIEEAPSPVVSEALRARICQAALDAAKAIDYHSTGTVEFLVKGEEFWFLEMNTRLQVEHPVTEAITGLDLVREQLLVAQGEPLGFSQASLERNGHAVEARLYAEDPGNEFLPATGEILLWQPSSVNDARFDAGIDTGCVVGIEFDPMLAKIISHAPTRREAVSKLARALETTRVQGVVTNRDFLVETLRTDEFMDGRTATDFIERVQPSRRRAYSLTELRHACIAAAMAAQAESRTDVRVLASAPSGWRNTLMPPQRRSFLVAGENIEVRYTHRRDGMFDCSVDEQLHRVRILNRGHDTLDLEIDDWQLQVNLQRHGDVWLVQIADVDLAVREQPRFPVAELHLAAGALSAPMPGRVVSTCVSVGESVEQGQLLLILEAMKMEHRVLAPVAGRITELLVEPEQQVANGDLLIIVDDS